MPVLNAPTRSQKPEHNCFRLIREITALSVADTWDAAKLEWALESVYFTAEPGRCLCGHRPIIEHCIIVNQQNENEAIVGNVCVKRFLGLPSDKLFAGINRIVADQSRSMNAETVEFTYRKGWLNEWERKFYLDTMRKRKPSEKQAAKRIQINRRVLNWMRCGSSTTGQRN